MMSKDSGIKTICREYTTTRDAKGSELLGIMIDHAVIGPALDVQVSLQYGRYCIEIKINSLQVEKILYRG